MPDSKTDEHFGYASLEHLKEFSGRRIESERRRHRLSQRHFARRIGMSVRWLREIESGNPAVKLDDHLRCAAALHLAPAFVLLPLLDPDYQRSTPSNTVTSEFAHIENLFWALVSRRAGRAALRYGVLVSAERSRPDKV